MSSPRMVKVPLADGLGIYYVFDYIIQYKIAEDKRYLAFHYIQSEDMVSLKECKNWVWSVKNLGYDVRVCLVTDKGFSADALEYVRNNSFDTEGRLILAKYCGDEEQTLVLNRWRTNHKIEQIGEAQFRKL